MGKLGQGGGLGGWRRRRKAKGINDKQVDKVLKSKKVAAALDSKSKAVQQYWQSIAPVFDPDDPREHRKKPARGHIGSYRDSIRVFDISDGDGLARRVKPTDWKSKMIEFGNAHMPEYAPMAKTKARFRK